MESEIMEQGTLLPPFELKNYDGAIVSSHSFIDKKLLLLVFTCNHCPYAKASWPILIDLQKRYTSDGLQIVAINPNNNPNPKYEDDRFEKMAPYAKEIALNFPYLFDENQEVAKDYKATCTPDPFLFAATSLEKPVQASEFSLFYHGRLNDNWQEPEKVTENSMELFILSALGKAKAPEKSFPSIGCSIKWV